MLWPGIKKLGKELNLKRTDSEVLGLVKNCFVKMYDGNNRKILEIYSPLIDENDKEYLINILTKYKIKKYNWPLNGINIEFTEIIRPYPIKKIKEILIEITGYFSTKYPGQKHKCQKCEQDNEADLCCVNNISMFVCNECYKEMERNSIKENMEQQNIPNNYFLGFIGALLFAIPGIILTIIFFVYLNIIGAISALLYVFLGTKGYKLFKGKTTPFGVGIISIVAIIMVAVGIFVSYSVIIFREINTIDFDALIYVLKVPEVKKELILNIVLSYIFSSLYLALNFYQMFKVWKPTVLIHKGRDI